MTNKFKYLLSAVIFILSYVLMIGGAYADNSCQVEMRTLVETINGTTCFSIESQTTCNTPCVPAATQNVTVSFYCPTFPIDPNNPTKGEGAILLISAPTSCKLPD